MAVNTRPAVALDCLSAEGMFSLIRSASTACIMAKPALDEEFLAELSSLMGEGFRGFVSIFTEDTRVCLAAVRAAASNHDREQLKRLSHLLKGSVANASAMTLSSLCAQLESLVSDGSPGQIDELITCIEAEFQRVAEALREAVR